VSIKVRSKDVPRIGHRAALAMTRRVYVWQRSVALDEATAARQRTAMSRRARTRWRRSPSHGDGGEKGYSGNWKRLSMSTTVLAYLILFMGFITFLCGAFGVLMLLFEEVSKTQRVQFRYYAMVIGLISGGLGMIGIGQGLRLLLLILGKPA